MTYTILINGVEVQPTLGFSTTFRLDDKLDTAALVLPFENQASPLEMFSTVSISDGVNTTYWLLMSDNVTALSVDPLIYTHTLDLVEYTKKLEYYFITAATFTQPTDGTIRYNLYQVVDRLRKISITERQNSTTPYPFEISQEVEDYLSNFKAPEMFFNNLTLFEALKQVLMYIGIMPRLGIVGNQDVLILDFVANQTNLVDINNLWVGKVSDQNASFYTSTLVSEADNIISTDLRDSSVYYPDSKSWARLSSPDGTGIVSNERSVMNLEKGINELIKLQVKGIAVYYNSPTDFNDKFYEFEFDLTDYVFTKEQYNLLPAEWTYGADIRTQLNTIWYEQNSPTIEGLTTNWRTNFDLYRRSLENAIATELVKIIPDAVRVIIKDDYYRVLFRAEFIPIEVDRHLEIERTQIDFVNKNTKMFFRQSDRLISLDNYTSRIKKMVDRLGEPNFTITIFHTDPSNLLQVGNYTADNYYLTVADFQYEQDYIIGNYEFSNNLPNINEFIGIDRGVQPFEIPTGYKVLNRSILYKDYLTISLSSSSTNDTLMLTDGITQLIKTFDNSFSALPSETALVVNPDIGVGTQRIYAPTIINGIENAFLFNFGFQDNQIAGYRLIPLDGQDPGSLTRGVIQQAVVYAEDGLMDTYAFDIKPVRTDASIPTTFAQAQAEANFLPYVNWDINEPTYIGATSQNPIVILKDPAEILNFNYQLNVFANTEQIIVGKNFTRLNKLIYDLDEPLYIHYSSEPYNQYENTSVKGGALPELLSTTTVATLPYRLNILNSIPANANSYAIGTASGDLLLAVNRVNGALPTILYFNFSHSRPGTTNL